MRYLDTIILAITYEDDTQLYISFKCKDPLELLTRLNMCISDIRVWMIKNKLKINDLTNLIKIIPHVDTRKSLKRLVYLHNVH